MMFASAALADVSFGSAMADNGLAADPQAARPIVIEINSVSVRDQTKIGSIAIDDTVMQQSSARCTLIAPLVAPRVGDRVRILYYDFVLFAGTIENIENTIIGRGGGSAHRYDCECADWSQILIRRKVHRAFANMSVLSIAQSLLANELAGEGVTLGTIDVNTVLPLVSAEAARVSDLLRDVATMTGQAFGIDVEKKMTFRSTTIETAPFAVTASVVEQGRLRTDRETYRNIQTVVATGKPSSPSVNDPAVQTVVRSNNDQITERAAIEGGTGRYEEIEAVTHPTSNDSATVALLAVGVARLLLTVSGSPRQSVAVRMRGYGFRAGQVATINLPELGIASSAWLVQRVRIQEEDGRNVIYDLELTPSTTQQRAYETWLAITRKGKVTIQPPDFVTTNLQSFSTPGSFTWTVPAGVTAVEFTAYGAGGGSGGYWRYTVLSGRTFVCGGIAFGGNGGNGGKAITILSVLPNQIFDVVVGAAGMAGANGATGFVCTAAAGADGGAGGLSSISRFGVVKCRGDAGGAGSKATGDEFSGTAGANGANGSGLGDGVTVGGGKLGASGNPSAAAGQAGLVEIRW